MKKVISFLSLFTSLGTLVCCALPVLFVTLGFGAAFAGLVTNVPELIWISEHKALTFGLGALLLAVGGILQVRAKNLACPSDVQLAQACGETKNWSQKIYFLALGMYSVGAF